MATPFNILAFLLTRNAAQELPADRKNLFGFLAGATAGPGMNLSNVLAPIALAGKEVAETQRAAAEAETAAVRNATLTQAEIAKAIEAVPATGFNKDAVLKNLNDAIIAKQPTAAVLQLQPFVLNLPPGVVITTPPQQTASNPPERTRADKDRAT